MTVMDIQNASDGVSVHAGFPNPATDKSLDSLDLNRLLVQNSASTFLFRIRGSEWQAMGIFDNDIAIIDRALDARANDLIICASEMADSFMITRAKNIPPNTTTWGVITSIIHQFRSQNNQT